MKAEVSSATSDILLLADHEAEIRLIQGAAGPDRVTVVDVCPDVLAYLRRQDAFRNAARPDLIILDLDLSNPAHCDTLRDLKNDRELRRIPVVVIAPDSSRTAIEDAYDLHANAYIVKPSDPEEFVRVIKATLSFWLKLARLPKD